MTDKLVVFYSRSGSTKVVAEKLAEFLNCDIAEIISKKNFKGIFGWLAAGRAGMGEKNVEIVEPDKNPDNYDSVIVCSPVWAGNMSAPVRTYLKSNRDKFKKVSYLLTCGGDAPYSTFEKMSSIGGAPSDTIHLSDSDRKSNTWIENLKTFADNL